MKIIFDTDPGIDDAMALLYLHACSDLSLLGITTTPGNANLENCTNNALFLSEQFGITAPVFRGREEAINGKPPVEYPDFVHGENGLGDIDVKVSYRTTESMAATEALIKLAKQHSGELTIIAVGRLTNIALAIQADDEFANNIERIVFMGGAYQCEGNVTPFAEANIAGDPEAAQIVFGSGIPLTMVGLDVTMQTRLSSNRLNVIADASGTLASLLLTINHVYAKYYLGNQGWDAIPVHDSSAVACTAMPDLFKTQAGRLNCVLEGDERGRTLLSPGDGVHLVCVGVDSEAMLQHYQDCVTAGRPLWDK
ncbi:MAG: purine nucleosidase [Candidatus Azotimanducaceae bacterium]|jgi:purine nucleosidase